MIHQFEGAVYNRGAAFRWQDLVKKGCNRSGFPTPVLSGSGDRGMISARAYKHPQPVWLISLKYTELTCYIPTLLYPESGSFSGNQVLIHVFIFISAFALECMYRDKIISKVVVPAENRQKMQSASMTKNIRYTSHMENRKAGTVMNGK